MITPSLLPAGVAALGLALLDGRIAPALWLSLRVGLGIAMWLVLWQAGGAWIAASGRLSWLTADAGHALALNAGLGLIASLPCVLALRLTARAAPLGGLHGLAWFGGLILPQLGQAGAWPPASLTLAVAGAGLAMGLGRLAGGGSP
ncbi:MAG: hypothetical protein ACU0AY_14995 [Marinibacterium profundimaris]